MGDLLDAYDASVKANGTIQTDVDQALVAAGRAIAGRVDDAIESGEGQEVTKALYLLPHMVNILREMQATPKARHDAGIEAAVQKASGVAKFRAMTGGKSA